MKLFSTLCLLWSLAEVHSEQTFPYVSFMGQTLANHSYVDLSLVGNVNVSSVQCITDLQSCCSNGQGTHRGNWFFPYGTRLPFEGDIHQVRTAQRVDLRRTVATSPSGMYRCAIPTVAVHDDSDLSVRETVFVGIYGLGAGNIKVHRHVLLTVHDSHQFTLSCISTSGPATTVTWTRNSTTVTEGNSTMLMNSVTAEYIHSLNISGNEYNFSSNEVFTCNVSNRKPSFSTASAVVSSNAQGVVIITPSSDNITVGTLLTLNCTGEFWSNTTDGNNFQWMVPDSETPTEAGPISLSQAGAYTCYSGSLRATSIITVEVSVPTPSVTIGSHPFAGESLTMTCSFTLHPSVDTHIESRVTWRVNGSAVNLNNDRISNEDNSLTFSPVTTSDTGFYECTLTLTPQNPYVAVHGGPKQSTWEMITVKFPQPNITVSLNQSYPLYAGSIVTISCTVAIDPHINNNERVSIHWNVNNGGRYTTTPDMDGSYTSSLIISPAASTDDGKTFTCTGRVTGGTGVQQPNQDKYITLRINDLLSVNAVNQSLTKIWISWTMEREVNVTHYTITYSSIHPCFDDSVKIVDIAKETMYTLTGLEDGTEYLINVTASVKGWKVGSYTTTAITITSVPSAPPSPVRLSVSSVTSITVQWGSVECRYRNGEITGYVVRYGEEGSSEGDRSVHMVSGDSSGGMTTISGLTKQRVYTVEVAAVNSAGNGEYSGPQIIKIPETQNVYLSLNDIIIPNNGYVPISSIPLNNNGGTALLCHTNRLPPQEHEKHSGGDWFSPNGTRVGSKGSTNVPGFERNRGSMVVRLKRTNGAAVEGIYWCTTRDDLLKPWTVYVGLYHSGKGNISLLGGMTFNTSILNEDQFTLTCISTGGPATTVTWTRDSTPVAEGKRTYLSDPVTAQYTHTLTVTTTGEYSCTVSNNKPSNVSATLRVQVAKPVVNLMVTTDGNIIETTWSTGHDHVTGYKIFYYHSNGSTTTFKIKETGHKFNVENKKVYRVSVQALSVHLPSIITGPVTVRVPEAVGNISVSVRGEELIIAWEHTLEPNDFSWNYTVSITNTESGSEVFRRVLPNTLTNVSTLELVKGVSYNMSVFVTNGKGSSAAVSKRVLVPNSASANSSPSDSSGSVAAGIIIPAVVVIIIAVTVIIFIIRRRRSHRGSVRVKSKPPRPPPPKRGKREKGGELEMEDIVDTNEKDKQYFFKNTSNIVSDVPEAEFPDYVSLMHQDRDTKLEIEFKSLERAPQPPSEVARLPSNVRHNRFKNILPYDHNRVHLNGDPEEDGSEYINASFIDGYPSDDKRAYIASQGPTEHTVGRFWEMVWEYQISTIVMLTRCVEDRKKKCQQYWPAQTYVTETKGSKFDITVTSCVPFAEYQIRKLQLQSTSDPEQEWTVTHMLYTAWPDHGVPRNAMSLISFIRRVRKEHPTSLATPLLVHCSAGVGRTGTFILLDLAIQQMKREGTLSVFSHLQNMRDQRMKMVQTLVQYVFIHDSLSELVVCGETEALAGDLRMKMMSLERPAVSSGPTGYQKQFQILEKVSSQYKASYQEATAKYNSSKNRFPDKLPNEFGRVRLKHGPTPGSDYINASFIDGYKHKRAYIATQGPLSGTVGDMWRMIWENDCSCILMLCQTTENGQESSQCFWPQSSGEEILYGKIRIRLKRESHHGDITERRLELEETEGRKRAVTLLQLTSWAPGELPHPTAILSLVELLSKALRSCPSRHTTIICSDGVGRTGTFICLHSQLERLKMEGVVDFFQAVKSARIQRAGLIPDAAHYAFCHEVLAAYVDSFETYSNFKEVV